LELQEAHEGERIQERSAQTSTKAPPAPVESDPSPGKEPLREEQELPEERPKAPSASAQAEAATAADTAPPEENDHTKSVEEEVKSPVEPKPASEKINKREEEDFILPPDDNDNEPGIQPFDSWDDVWDKLEIDGWAQYQDFKTGRERYSKPPSNGKGAQYFSLTQVHDYLRATYNWKAPASSAQDSIPPPDDDDNVDDDKPGIQPFDSWDDVWDKLENYGWAQYQDFKTGHRERYSKPPSNGKGAQYFSLTQVHDYLRATYNWKAPVSPAQEVREEQDDTPPAQEPVREEQERLKPPSAPAQADMAADTASAKAPTPTRPPLKERTPLQTAMRVGATAWIKAKPRVRSLNQGEGLFVCDCNDCSKAPYTAISFRLPDTETFTVDKLGFIRKDIPMVVARNIAKSSTDRMRRHLREKGIPEGHPDFPLSLNTKLNQKVVSKQLQTAKRKRYEKLAGENDIFVVGDVDDEEMDANIAKFLQKKQEAAPKKKLGRPFKKERLKERLV
jgi:hypothetical protein